MQFNILKASCYGLADHSLTEPTLTKVGFTEKQSLRNGRSSPELLMMKMGWLFAVPRLLISGFDNETWKELGIQRWERRHNLEVVYIIFSAFCVECR